MVLGLDEFKHINDLYDRMFGDEVLRIITQRIQGLLSDQASVYRLDGDEFGIIISGGDKEDAVKLYDSIHTIMQSQQEYEGKKYYCTVSAGCASYPEDGNTCQDLFKYAAYSLESAKNNGKHRLELFSKSILQHKERSLELTELLRESVEHDFAGFAVHFQPQVDAKTRCIVGAEALTRWSCAEFGPISPMEFIPLLEESGMIIPVGKWIFRQAVAACAQWSAISPGFTVSVNVSSIQLTDPDFGRPMPRRSCSGS